MRADGQQKDGLLPVVFDESENDSQIVTGTARPSLGKFAFEFVGSQPGLEGVGLKIPQG